MLKCVVESLYFLECKTSDKGRICYSEVDNHQSL